MKKMVEYVTFKLKCANSATCRLKITSANGGMLLIQTHFISSDFQVLNEFRFNFRF